MKDLFGHDKVEEAIERLRMNKPTVGATSFGKDSIVIMDLAKRAGLDIPWIYSVTTLDMPELIYFGKRFKDVIWNRPSQPLLTQVAHRGFPTSSNRWCCHEYKESFGKYERIILGVRWAESKKRSLRKFVEPCFKDSSKTYINPILDWKDSDVWRYIKENHLPYCPLYNEGFKRLGCVMCPKASFKNRQREMAKWPKIAEGWKRAFKKLYEQDRESVHRWHSWEEMFKWWMSESQSKVNPDQTVMFE